METAELVLKELRGDVLIVTPVDSIGLADGLKAARALGEALHHTGKVVLDLGQLDCLEGDALCVLLSKCADALAVGARVKLCNVPQEIRGVFRHSKLSDYLQVHGTVADAINAFDA